MDDLDRVEKKILKKELLQVCVGLYQVILNLESDISICIECDFECFPKGDYTIENANLPKSAFELLNFIGKRINKIVNLESKVVKIFFSKKEFIVLHKNTGYESYQILISGHPMLIG